MSYKTVENETISRDLENIANWLREEDTKLLPQEQERFLKLADKIMECMYEFDEINDDYWNRMAKKDELEEQEKLEKEKQKLMNLSKEELVRKIINKELK